MAERRMFAKTIIDSDAFLDMPLSAQALYFHLSMRADDDGFINNPKKIQRMVGASDDDCKLLIMKRFIITFDSGVIVIKHWKIHNYIQKDRYKPTIYQEEKSLIAEKENKAYTECIHDVYSMDTQDRGRSELEQELVLGEGRVHDSAESLPPPAKVEYQQIVDLYHSICKSLPSVRTLTDARKKAIKARLKTYTVDDFKTVFENAEASSFLKGEDGGWKASFDWLIKEGNMLKVLEGNYADKPKRKEIVPSWCGSSLDPGFEEAMLKYRPKFKPKTAAEDDEIRAKAEALRKELSGNG